jgi:hypothetical protein
MAALSAELELGWIEGAALRADPFELSAAFPAEFGSGWVLEFAFLALHNFPRQIVEGGRLVESLKSEETQHDGMNNDYLCPPGNPSLV